MYPGAISMATSTTEHNEELGHKAKVSWAPKIDVTVSVHFGTRVFLGEETLGPLDNVIASYSTHNFFQTFFLGEVGFLGIAHTQKNKYKGVVEVKKSC